MRYALTGLIVALAGCAHTPAPRPVEIVPERVEVLVRAACPAPAERERLRALRPAPLRDTPMPATVEQRVAAIVAQLGMYEAAGRWADQVDAALDRCQRD